MDKWINFTVAIFKKSGKRLETFKFLNKCILCFICTVLASSIYASDACKYSEFDLNTLPTDPMKAIHAFKTIGPELTFIGYSFNNQPGVQLVTLDAVTNKYFTIITIRDLHSQQHLALDIIQKTSPKEYLQIRVVGKIEQITTKPVEYPQLKRIVNKKIVAEKAYINRVYPHWIKIGLVCQNGDKYHIFGQKERVMAEVYYTKKDNSWEKTIHHHIYPTDHPMMKGHSVQ